jgi:hypothetical protein
LLVSLCLQALVELPVDGGRHPLWLAAQQIYAMRQLGRR